VYLHTIWPIPATLNPKSRVELGLWELLLEVGRCALAALFALQARRATERDIDNRGLERSEVRLRLDYGYWHCLTTTFGSTSFPLFVYR